MPSNNNSRSRREESSTGLRITYLQNPSVELVNQNATIGEGIKKTYQYDTPMTRDQLQKWREEFWETRTAGAKEVWELLHNAIVEDEETALAMIAAAELQLP